MATRTTTTTSRATATARGGISGGAIVTGVVVAFGAMFLLSAIVGAIAYTAGYTELEAATGELSVVEATVAGGIALMVAQFVSYLWGGYTAARMGRGAGIAHGLLVPLVAILLGLVTAAAAARIADATTAVDLPFSTLRLPVEGELVVDWTGYAILGVIAMFAGGGLGGFLGARWHTHLEERALDATPTDTTTTTTSPAAAPPPPQTTERHSYR